MSSKVTPRPFFEQLADRVERSNSLLCVGLDPDPASMPTRFAQTSQPLIEQLLAWNLEVVESTAEFACVFKPNIAFYESLGSDGYSLLQSTLNAIPDDIPVILDAKRGDIGNTAAAYATACFDQLQVDAVTLNAYLGRDSIQPFVEYTDKGLFILCHTSNPGSKDFQELEISDWSRLDREANQPLYMHVARTAAAWSPNIGFVVGATYPESIAAIRELAPHAWMLIPGVGAQGGDLQAALSAGLRDDGMGLVMNVSRGISSAFDPALAARTFRDRINDARQSSAEETARKLTTDVTHAHDEIITRLVELGAVKFGNFKLASGVDSPIYIDLRLLVSDPNLLAIVAERYAQLLHQLPVDRIAGVPYAALPIGTAVSLASGVPLIYPRKEVKEYGLQRGIEGAWEAGERVVIIEDLITSGGSTIKSAQRLREAGLIVEHAIVLIDREQGGVENLAEAGVEVRSVFKLSEILMSLEAQRAITSEQAEQVRAFIQDSRK